MRNRASHFRFLPLEPLPTHADRQGDAQVFKKYSQMKLQMKREAPEKLNRYANEMPLNDAPATKKQVVKNARFCAMNA
jgi:hypothetical protein